MYLKILYLVLIFFTPVWIGCGSAPKNIREAFPAQSIEIPTEQGHTLQPYGKISFGPITESSGIIKSRMWDNVYWTHNDSFDEARIFAIRRNGEFVKPTWTETRNYDYTGIKIPDAVNIDWEDITADDAGNLIIAACGNNRSQRRDLSIYIIPEPNPGDAVMSTILQKIMFQYPDQVSFSPQEANFDCEAIFSLNGKVYFLTKHRSDSHTTLYRLDNPKSFYINKLTLLGEFNINGFVTAADAIGVNGMNRLAVLTYNAVWIFECRGQNDDFFNGRVYWYPIKAKQCEGICFDNENTLLITNEQRDLYELKLDQFKLLRQGPN